MRCHRPALFALVAAALTGCASTYATGVGVPDPPLPLTDLPRPPSAGFALPGLLRAEDLVEVEALTENRFVRAEKPGEIAVRLHLRAKTRKVENRPPINLGLVVDTSGSMEGSSIDHARAAALSLVDALAEGDRLALVVYNSSAEVLLPSTVLTAASLADVRARIGGMKANGTTDLAGGLSAGLAEVRRSFQAGGINRIVVLGDGVPNDAAPLPSLAQMAGQSRIAVTMLGLGLDYDETLMSQLALASGGRYHYLKDSSQVAQVFADEVLHLKEVAGRGTVVTLTPGPGVTVKEVIGLPTRRAGTRTSVILGDMSEGDRRDVVVRLSVAGRHASSVVELIDADVSADDLDRPGQRLSERAFVSVRSTADAAQIAEGGNREVKQVIARLSVADAIVRAVAAVRGGDLALGRKLLDAAEKEAKTGAKDLNDPELAEKAKTIGPLRKSLASLAPPPPPVVNRFGAVTTAPRPMPAAPSPAHAGVVMKSQFDAMREIQGF
jgi:Ca-activated chloride channel family protein